MKQYHVSHNGEEVGPFTIDEIVNKLKSNELAPMDFVFDEDQDDWVAMLQVSEIASQLQAPNSKPKSRPKPKSAKVKVATTEVSSINKSEQEPADKTWTDEALNVEWYVLKGENKFGPFQYTDVLKMLQQKIVFEFDFAWYPGLSTWQRIAELEAFSAENINKLKNTLMPEIDEVFFRRRHRRVEFHTSVLVHNNASVWKGQGVEISAGGVGIVVENSLFVPGDEVLVHFKPSQGLPSFNAACEVVSKKFVDGLRDKTAPVKYGLKFTGINKQMQEMLQNFSKNAVAAA